MAETKKVTKRDYFGMVKGIVEAADVANKTDILNFIDHEVSLLDKKSGKGKETKTQKANSGIKGMILEVLAEQESPVTITQLMEDSRLATYDEETKDGVTTVKMSNQKLSAVMKQLVDSGAVVKTEDKKRSYFSLPTE